MHYFDYIYTRKDKSSKFQAESIELIAYRMQPRYSYILTGIIIFSADKIEPMTYDVRKRAPPPSSFV